jgi:hypothetical protein
MKAIVSAPQLKNVVQLQSFIGLVNYYSKFIPHLNQKLRVFYDLVKKDAKWNWTKECSAAFEYCKNTTLRPYEYIFGHYFVVSRDHKPLMGIISPKKGEPPVVANRLQVTSFVYSNNVRIYQIRYSNISKFQVKKVGKSTSL